MITPFVADAIFWVAVACCLVAQAAILRSVVATRHATPPSGGRRATELVWAIVPAVALVLVLGATWRALHPAPAADGMPVAATTAAGVSL